MLSSSFHRDMVEDIGSVGSETRLSLALALVSVPIRASRLHHVYL